MVRAKCIPSTTGQRQSEERRVINYLEANNSYPEDFIKSVDQPNNPQPKPRENLKAYSSIPYVKGVSERIRRILNCENIKTAFKPRKTLGHVKFLDKNSVSERSPFPRVHASVLSTLTAMNIDVTFLLHICIVIPRLADYFSLKKSTKGFRVFRSV